jgi:hypothetical protein
VERDVNDIRFLPPLKLAPDLAKAAADAADECVAGMEKEHSANDFEIAGNHVALATAYRAAGEKKKARDELNKAKEVLQAIAKQANDAVEKANAAEKELGE